MSTQDSFSSAGGIILSALSQFLIESKSGSKPVIHRKTPSVISQELTLNYWIENGGLIEGDLQKFMTDYLSFATRLHHPNYMSHQVSSPNDLSALADLIHGATNNPMAVYEMGPANGTIELIVLNWMLDKVGWHPISLDGKIPDSAGGILTHGGSLANLTAMLAARAAIVPEAWEEGVPNNLVVLAPAVSHYSISRALSIIGLGQKAFVDLPADDLGRILPDQVEKVIRKCRSEGKKVMALIASAGATGTGLYDDLRSIGKICNAQKVWFHVDGAHGASALLSDKVAYLLDGLELADSVIWDAHKMMQTAALSTALLVKNGEHLDLTFQQKASYLIYENEPTYLNPIHRTIECTKAALGLKVFFALAYKGEKAMGAFVAGRYQLAQDAHQLISKTEGFECPYLPDSNILCFRYGTDNQLQLDIREALMEQELFHLTSTELNGIRYLRLTIMSENTTIHTIQDLINLIPNLASIILLDTA